MVGFWTARLAAACAAFLLVWGPASGQDGDAISTAYARNGSLSSYTFTLHGAMRMHSFPWLHFSLDGRGVYERGRRYDVHFEHMPFFAKSFSDLDLSPLAPALWKNRYQVSYVGKDGADDVYALHDPSDAALKVALVHVDPSAGVREVDLHYANGGDVDLTVQCISVDGYLVPGVTQARVAVPEARLSVRAQFTDYAMNAGRSIVGSTHTR